MKWSFSLADLRDIVQILFFILTAILGLLTFLQAKKSLFFPIRTEIFKERIKLFSTLLTLFQGKNRSELFEDFGFAELVKINLALLADNYIASFFGQQIQTADRPYANVKSSMVFMPERKDALTLEGESLAVPFLFTENLKPRQNETNRMAWDRYRHINVPLPDAFIETERQLRKLASSPLMPEECVTMLQEYIGLLSRNATLLAIELEVIAQELPDRWPMAEKISPNEIFWVNNRINEKMEDPTPIAQAIIKFVRDYCDSKKLLEM